MRELRYSPLRLVGTTLGMAFVFLAGPLLAIFADRRRRLGRRHRLGADDRRLFADACGFTA